MNGFLLEAVILVIGAKVSVVAASVNDVKKQHIADIGKAFLNLGKRPKPTEPYSL